MRLKSPREAPPNGGFYFICEDGRRITSHNLQTLDRAVADYLAGNSKPIPKDLRQIIEDQICSRLPDNLCWKGLGDRVAGGIEAVAGKIDKVLGTNIKANAKRCGQGGGCSKRRRILNSLVN